MRSPHRTPPPRRRVLLPLLLVAVLAPAARAEEPTAPAAEPAAQTDPRGAELIAAAQRGDVAQVKALLAAGVDVDATSRYGATAIFFAADKGNVELARLLLEAGADVELSDTFYGATAIQWVLFKAQGSASHREVLHLMLPRATPGGDAAGAALMLGVESGDLALVKTAVEEAQADPKSLRAALAAANATANDTEGDDNAELRAYLAEHAPPADPDAFELPAEAHGAYLGEYASAELGFGVTVTAEADGLRITFPGGEPMRLVPSTAVDFEVAGAPGVAVRFAAAEAAAAPMGAVTVVQGEREMLFPRKGAAAETPPAASVASSSSPRAAEEPATRTADRPWPGFRGDNNAGIGDGQGAPLEWNATAGENVAWKTRIPGLGLASPVVAGGRVFVTSAVSPTDTSIRTGLYGDVDSVEDDSPHVWKVYALDLATGEVVWERTAAEGRPQVKRHLKSSHANPTPVTDGRHLVVSFGSEGLHAYDLDGKLLWKKDLGVLAAGWFYDPTYEWEFGSSPILHDGMVIVQADVYAGAFVAAFDVETGRELWRTSRDEVPTWGTPAILPGREGGPDELVTNGTTVRGYDVATGEELWTLAPNSEITVASPVVADGLAYIVGGYAPVQPIYAVAPGGRGDLSLAEGETSNATVAWSQARGGSYIPTPIAYRGLLYVLHNNGRLAAYDGVTGEEIYRERVGRGEGFSSSPVAADGRLYMTSEDGTTYVVRAGRAFELLTENELGEAVLTTPAISAGRFVLRGQEHVFALASYPSGETPSGETDAAAEATASGR